MAWTGGATSTSRRVALGGLLAMAATAMGPGRSGAAVLAADAAGTTSLLPLAVVQRGWQGAVDDRGFTVSVELDAVAPARLVVATSAELSAVAYGPTSTPTSTWVKLASPALRADTTYHWGVEVSDGMGGWVLDAWRGRIRTFPPAGVAADVSIAAASCARTGSTARTFSRIADRRPHVFLHLGDLHYANIGVDDPAPFRAAFRKVLDSPAQRDLYNRVPTAHSWDDHDFGPNGSSSTSPGRRAALSTYREVEPHYEMAMAGADDEAPITHAFWLGRVLVVMLDVRSTRVARTRKLGAAQLAWLLGVIDGSGQVQGRSTAHAELLVLNVGTPWIASSGTDTWAEARSERRTIADAIEAAGRIDSTLIIAGDAHCMAFDDGTHNTFATSGAKGCRVANLGPLDQSNSTKGGPYTKGPYTTSQTMYGTIDVADTGADITVTVAGWDAATDSIVGSGAGTIQWTYPARGVSGAAVAPAGAPLRSNSFEGGAIGRHVTIGNSGGASGDPFTIRERYDGLGGVVVYAAGLRGRLGGRAHNSGGTAKATDASVGWTVPAAEQLAARFYLRIPSYAGSPEKRFARLGGGTDTSTAWQLVLGSGVDADRLRIRLGSRDVAQAPAASRIPADRTVRVEVLASSSSCRARVWLDPSSTGPADVDVLAAGAGPAKMDRLEIGQVTPTSSAYDVTFDDVALGTGWLGPSPDAPATQAGSPAS